MDSKRTNKTESIKSLLDHLEKISNLDFSSTDDTYDLKAQRKKEALEVEKEIEQIQKAQKDKNIASIRETKHIPECSFDTLEQNDNLKKAINACRQFSQSFDRKVIKTPLLLIRGARGTGKTTLAYCILNDLINNGFDDFEFLYFEEITRVAKLFWNSNGLEQLQEYDQRWNRIINCKLLVIDNFALNKAKLSVFEQKVLSEVLQLRYRMFNRLIITTVCSDNELNEILGTAIDFICDYDTYIVEILANKSYRTNPKRIF